MKYIVVLESENNFKKCGRLLFVLEMSKSLAGDEVGPIWCLNASLIITKEISIIIIFLE